MSILGFARLAYGRYRLAVLGVFLALLPLVIWGALKATETTTNNIRQWLPRQYEATHTYEWFRRHFPSDEFAFVTWDGCTLDDQRLAKFAALLRSRMSDSETVQADSVIASSFFARVQTGPELLQTLTDPPLSLERERAIDRLAGLVIGKDREKTAALVTLSAAGNADRVRALEVLKQVATKGVGVPESDLHLVGEPIFNAKTDLASEQALSDLPRWSVIIAALVALISLRSVRLMLVVFVAASYCGILAQAMVYFTGGTLNLVLVVMPVLVYVLSLSAAVHLVNYYRDAVAEQGVESAPVRAIQYGFAPCTLAAVTTAIGLGSLQVSQIIPVRDFGFYAASGILASLIVLFLFLPSLLSTWSRRPRRGERDRAGGKAKSEEWFAQQLQRAADWIIRHRIWLAIGCGATLLIGTAGVQSIRTTVDPVRFFPETSRLLRDYDWVEEHFGPIIPVEVVVVFDKEQTPLTMLERLQLVDEIGSELADMQGIGATMSTATFAPPLEPERRAEPRRPGGLAGLLEGLGRAAGASPERVRRSVLNSQLEQNQEKFIRLGYLSQADGQELWRISARAAGQGSVEQALFMDSIKSQVQDFLQQQPDERLAGMDVEYTGMVPLFYLAQRELLRGLFRSFLLAFLLIAVLMVLVLKSLRGGLVAMLPNIFPSAIVFGFMGHFAFPVDIGSMLTASAAMGIAVDDTVHFLTWFRRGLEQGMLRRDAIAYAVQRCGGAMLQTTAIAGLGLVVYAASSFQPVSQFGLLMFLLLTITLIGDLIFLPALLAGPFGKLFERSDGGAPDEKGQASGDAAEATRR